MEDILRPTNSTCSPFIQRFEEQKLRCTHYEKLSELLAESLFNSDKNHELFVDWSFNFIHPLIFDIDVKPITEKNNFDLLMRYVDSIFLNVLQKHLRLREVTMILAMRRNKASGLHIYVVDVELSHDDYIQLCQKIQSDCFYKEEDLSVYLDCPSRFALPASEKPEGPSSLYVPVRVLRVRFGAEKGQWECDEICLRQQEEKNFFDQVVYHPAQWKAVARAMIPLSLSKRDNSALKSFSKPKALLLHYATRIVRGFDPHRIAEFTSSLNQCSYSLVKERILTPNHEGGAFCYDFLESNAPHINQFKSKNTVLETWYGRFQILESPLVVFKSIDEELKRKCPHLKTIHCPLEKILKAYERPVYYALYNMTHDTDALYKEFPTLSRDLEVPKEANRLTLDTILYLAYQVNEGRHRFTCVGMGWDWILACTTTLEEMLEHVRFFQRKLFPIVKSTEKVYYYWDSVSNRWCEIAHLKKDLQRVIKYVVEAMTYFKGYHKIPLEFRDMLQNRFSLEWMEPLIQNILIELEESELVEKNSMDSPFYMYGNLVPEYYFFKRISAKEFFQEMKTSSN